MGHVDANWYDSSDVVSFSLVIWRSMRKMDIVEAERERTLKKN
jgi:hypothetical protein